MIKFNHIVNTILKEGRIPKNDVYSNIEIDATGFQSKLAEGKIDGLIQEWSGKSWLGGLPADKLRGILDQIASDLVEFPPNSRKEMQGTINSVLAKGVNRKDLQVKLTTKISNLLFTKEFNLIKVKESEGGGEQTVNQTRTGQSPENKVKAAGGELSGERFNAKASWEVLEAEGRKLDGDDRSIFYRVWEVVEPTGAEINPKNINEVYGAIGGELEARKFLQRLVNRNVIVPVDKFTGKEGDEEAGELPDKTDALDRLEDEHIDIYKQLGNFAPPPMGHNGGKYSRDEQDYSGDERVKSAWGF